MGNGNPTWAQWTTGGAVTIGQTASIAVSFGTILTGNFSSYTGSEVSRSFVPEPTSGTLLTAGLLGLAGLSAISRRRR
ncbi:MAG: PEP-CTERM sorting domain-containing protein [Deltaproteobacteria bacterium]|nr:PEP-CTERM sorting domain-containing protein [Deltaproteobacteria bacterium]MBW2421290.1 PEP-CTERM sorting domain-containing protein [Deltaproteobacteria bacterium]